MLAANLKPMVWMKQELIYKDAVTFMFMLQLL